ncbi:protein kinase [Acidisoma cellulosilytica]|uniref:Protein kinase n=1 Tax=Acidisoma cellulosilyticum TaxID=2802395 RepID=A0A963Z2Y8_9PROT|nr:serine/threonine-protein kinase [Acidisoma cellulosilyticum]MCB8881794.1 protein kinase [Acidisoma cellulosilyticum]
MTRRIDLAGWAITETVVTATGSGAVVTTGPADPLPVPGPPRGILAAVAQESAIVTDAIDAGPAAATLTLCGLVDGYYHARPTFGRGQALAQATEALNRWMFASRGQDATGAGLSASLSALVFSGSRVGLIQIGGGLILRIRAGEIVRVTTPQLLRLAQGQLTPRRAIGNDSRILLDYQEDTALAGDRYILISDIRDAAGGRIDTPALLALCRPGSSGAVDALAQSLAQFEPGAAALPAAVASRSVVILDIESLPEPSVAATETELSGLPLGAIPQAGDSLDGYTIGRTLHRGAYTLLKYAIDTSTREAVVLKFPLPAMLNDRVFQAGFARESWIGTGIHSPVIGRILASEPGRKSQLYIVMPYYLGETLESRIASEPRFGVPDIVAIGQQLAQAVEDLRAVQVLHRDLKPDNVMMLNGGGLRLLDLGLAYLAGSDASTAQGLAGTLRYMAPEVLRGGAPDDRTEVYALGTILYRLAGQGRFPRPGSDIAEALIRGRPDLPRPLCAAIASALETDPARRPAHAAVLAQALSNALQTASRSETAAARPILPHRMPEPVTVWRAVALLLGLMLLVSLALR